jgi:hypothetical protein
MPLCKKSSFQLMKFWWNTFNKITQLFLITSFHANQIVFISRIYRLLAKAGVKVSPNELAARASPTAPRRSDLPKLDSSLLHNLQQQQFPLPASMPPASVASIGKFQVQRVPTLRVFWDLEKTVLHEIRISGTVVSPLLTQKSPTCTYIGQKPW